MLLFITSLPTLRDNLHKTKLCFPKAQSLRGYLFRFKWNGSALPIISLSFLNYKTTTRHIVHPCCAVPHWRASVLIWNEKPQQKTFRLLQKVIYLETSLRCHIYPSKRQQSKQVIWDMSKTYTGKKRLFFQFKRNTSNPAAQSTWSQVKLNISAHSFLRIKGFFF